MILNNIIHKDPHKMKILIDNGHGCNTPGKRSPDGRFREYAYTRYIAKAVVGWAWTWRRMAESRIL